MQQQLQQVRLQQLQQAQHQRMMQAQQAQAQYNNMSGLPIGVPGMGQMNPQHMAQLMQQRRAMGAPMPMTHQMQQHLAAQQHAGQGMNVRARESRSEGGLFEDANVIHSPILLPSNWRYSNSSSSNYSNNSSSSSSNKWLNRETIPASTRSTPKAQASTCRLSWPLFIHNKLMPNSQRQSRQLRLRPRCNKEDRGNRSSNSNNHRPNSNNSHLNNSLVSLSSLTSSNHRFSQAQG